MAVVTQNTETLFKTHGNEGRRLRLRFTGKEKRKGLLLKLRFSLICDFSQFLPPFLPLYIVRCWFFS